jgi:hypothetical protein
MTFDKWREDYDMLTFAEQVAYHNELEVRYPHQAHFNLDAAKAAIQIANPKKIIEAGCWKADLAAEILKTNSVITHWQGIEICSNAKERTVCNDPRFFYRDVESFTWWNSIGMVCDLFIATHFCEHLSTQHFDELAHSLKSKYVYFEIPISEHGEEWNGYHGTHKLPLGWRHVIAIMGLNDYTHTDIAQHCKLFTKL